MEKQASLFLGLLFLKASLLFLKKILHCCIQTESLWKNRPVMMDILFIVLTKLYPKLSRLQFPDKNFFKKYIKMKLTFNASLLELDS